LPAGANFSSTKKFKRSVNNLDFTHFRRRFKQFQERRMTFLYYILYLSTGYYYYNIIIILY